MICRAKTKAFGSMKYNFFKRVFMPRLFFLGLNTPTKKRHDCQYVKCLFHYLFHDVFSFIWAFVDGIEHSLLYKCIIVSKDTNNGLILRHKKLLVLSANFVVVYLSRVFHWPFLKYTLLNFGE